MQGSLFPETALPIINAVNWNANFCKLRQFRKFLRAINDGTVPYGVLSSDLGPVLQYDLELFHHSSAHDMPTTDYFLSLICEIGVICKNLRSK